MGRNWCDPHIRNYGDVLDNFPNGWKPKEIESYCLYRKVPPLREDCSRAASEAHGYILFSYLGKSDRAFPFIISFSRELLEEIFEMVGGNPAQAERGHISPIVALVDPDQVSAVPLIGLENPVVFRERKFAPRSLILYPEISERLLKEDSQCWRVACGLWWSK